MDMKCVFVLLLVMLIAIIPATASSQETYYADVGMQVAENGNVMVSGTANHPGLSAGAHDEYTSKKGSYWLLNVTLDGEFSDYVYTLRMPPGSTVNYIKSSGRVSIGQEGESVVIEGTGKDTEFSVAVQYAISPPGTQAAWWIFPLPVAVTLLIILVWAAARKKRKAKGDDMKAAGSEHAYKTDKARYNPSMLAERQLAIVRALEAAGKPMTQRQIEQALSLPKSSVSRNISSLVRAGILARHSRGMSNAVWFSEKAEKSEKPAKS
jgi:uncharacterized membrane protein